MAFKSGFFNAENGDRRYNADDLSSFFFGVMTNGVMTDPPTSLAVQAGGGMTVNVLPGRAVVQGKYFINTSDFPLTIAPADYNYLRYDRVVLRLDLAQRFFEIAVRTGPLGPVPQAPELTRNSTIYEVSLALVGVPIESEEIVQAYIIDERPDKRFCGFAGLQAGEIAVQAVPPDGTAVITNAIPSADGKLLVDIRCNSISDVTPPSSDWALGSIAWDVSGSKMYGLDSSRQWSAQT